MLGELSLLEWGVLGVEVCRKVVHFELRCKGLVFTVNEGNTSEVARLLV